MRYRRSLFKFKLRKQTVYGIFSVGLALSAFLITLAAFVPRGALLAKVNLIINHYFSWTSVIFAAFLFLLAILLSQLKTKLIKMNLIFGLAIFWIALSGLTRAGIIGDQVWLLLEMIIPIGLAIFVVLFFTALFGLTIMFNLSLGEAINWLIVQLKAFKKFFVKYFSFDLFKKKQAVFVQDNGPVAPIIRPVAPPTTGLAPEIVQNPDNSGLEIWEYPPLDLLSDAPIGQADRGDVNHYATVIEKTLDSFGLMAKVAEVNKGPAVTQYALQIAQGTKISKITALQNDLALALAAPNGQIRIEAPIPGRSLVGIEIPNRTPEFVPLRKILESDAMRGSKSKLAVALGLDVSGKPLVADIAKMPHVLIAGATGSGKSICINAFIGSLLYRNSPNELKFILVDPKRVELSLYNGIPHLLTPVIVDLEKVLSALKWALAEMERRYKLFASVGVRNIDSYNELSGFQALPFIVIIVDELADVIMFAPVEVEDAICRLAQMARATGIHLIVSTQRPSVDVITGLIKANIPCRIAFNVTSMIDSRVIIDTPGAEKLLGRGDMLYIPPDQSRPTRIQGAFVTEGEVNKLVIYLKSKGVPIQYTEEVTSMPMGYKKGGSAGIPGGRIESDPLTDEAIHIVCQYDRASASLLQRKLSIGYARAARILDQLEALGIVGPGEGSKPRDVLVRNADEYFASKAQ